MLFGIRFWFKWFWFFFFFGFEVGLVGFIVWKERLEEFGSDSVVFRVFIFRRSRCYKVKGCVMFDSVFVFVLEGNEVKVEGY